MAFATGFEVWSALMNGHAFHRDALEEVRGEHGDEAAEDLMDLGTGIVRVMDMIMHDASDAAMTYVRHVVRRVYPGKSVDCDAFVHEWDGSLH
jgi:hypothetical protein